jgi:hypothetical protein
MDHFFSDDPAGAQPARTLADAEAPSAHPLWVALLAAFSGLLIPAAAAIAAAILLGPPRVPHASQIAKLAAAALTVAEAVFAGLGAAALVEAGWRRIGLPGTGPADFLPLRYIRHRLANRHVHELLDQLREAPPEPSRESLRALLDLSRELARRDIYTRAHSGRVSRLCIDLGKRIGLSPEDCEIARLAGLLHDIGKLEIPSAILNKPGPLDPDEAELVRAHPVIGASLVAPYIGLDIVDAVRHHHERVDGAGYPDGVDSDALPIISRLVPVVDTYDALISDRSYRPGRSREEAFLELRAVAGSQLDAELVDALIEMESAKVPFGGAVLGLAPVGALLRRAEHLLHSSAAPAAAAITALAVAGAGWLGLMSAGPTAVSAEHQVIATPAPSTLGASQNGAVPTPSPSGSAGAGVPPVAGGPAPSAPITVFFAAPSGTGKATTTKGAGGTLVAPMTNSSKTASGGTKSSTVITVIGPGPQPAASPTGSSGGGNPNPVPTATNPATPPSPAPPPPPAPVLQAINPSSGSVGAAATISGQNLGDATAVTFGSVAASITGKSSTSISVTVPPGSGTVPVQVSNPGGTAGGLSYAYRGPKITSVTDQYGNGPVDHDTYGPSSGGTIVTINGTNLLGATSVTIGNAPASITADTDNQILVSSPAESEAGAQENVILVTTPAGTGSPPGGGYEFDYGPNVTGVAPSSGPAGQAVRISGSNLSGATGVTFGGASAASFHVDSDSQVTAVAPGPQQGTVDIAVQNDAGSSDTGGFAQFTWSKPVVSGISPTSARAGTAVTISGSNFIGATSVEFGSARVSIPPSASDTTIVVNVPSGPSGAVAVTVTSPAGTSNSVAFTYQTPPSVSGITPSSGVTGTAVTISGSNLSGARVQFVGGTVNAAAPVALNTAGAIVVSAPAPGTYVGPVSIIVTTSQGSTTVTNGFAYT